MVPTSRSTVAEPPISPLLYQLALLIRTVPPVTIKDNENMAARAVESRGQAAELCAMQRACGTEPAAGAIRNCHYSSLTAGASSGSRHRSDLLSVPGTMATGQAECCDTA